MSDNIGTNLRVEGDVLTVERFQDCTPFLEEAHRRRMAGETGTKDMRFAMTIPDVIIEKYCNENGVSYREFIQNKVHVKRLVNDPEFKKLRIWEGRI